MKETRTPAAGSVVAARGLPWVVAHVEPGDGCALITLHGLGDENAGETARLLAPFDRPRTLGDSPRVRFRSRHDAMTTAAHALARAHPADGLWTATRSRIDLRAWQLEPALAVVRGATRILLADAVGLGKTIQAGLIAAELVARGLAARMLVLTPAGLREQWASELGVHFGLDATVLDQAAVGRAARSLPPSVNPWGEFGIIISSIDLVKRPEVRAAIEAAPFDVLIVDEAHHVTPGSDRGALVSTLAARTPWVVLVTATPHDGDAADYAYLLNLGAAPGDEPMTTFQRDAGITGGSRRRRERVAAVRPTAAEAALGDALRAYGRTVLGTGDDRPGARLVAAVLERRGASSPAAAVTSLTRRLALLAGRAAPGDPQPRLPWDETDGRDGTERDDVLGAPGIVGLAADRRALEHLIVLAARATADAGKPARLRRLLARTSEPAVVFSEYRDTVEELHTRLAAHERVVMVHGGLPLPERRRAVDAFVRGEARVLLATDAAGEGLNLQARCRLVVHMEPPWNPLRLEQRAGRVDRLGQTRLVHLIHLVQPGSIEDHVGEHLAGRRARILAAAPVGRPVEREAIVEAARAAAARRLLRAALPDARSGTGGRPDIVCARASGRRPVSAVTCLFGLTLADADGRLVERHHVALAIQLDRPHRPGRGTLRRVCRAARRARLVAACLDRASETACLRAGTGRHASIIRTIARVQRVRTTTMPRRTSPLQASLFNREAERAWQARQQRDAARVARLTAIERMLQASAEPRASAPARLLAVWDIPRESRCFRA